MDDVLVPFLKAPAPGRVKTRLVPPLTYAEAAALYRGWVRDLGRTLGSLKAVTVRAAYDAHADFPDLSWAGLGDIPFFPQTGGDLGERMLHAFETGFSSGAKRTVIIGSDSPGLPAAFIEEAFACLKTNDLALGPTADGGYYLIGLRGRAPAALFDRVDWSTPRAFEQTLENARKLALSVHLLPGYFDVDLPEDLKRIPHARS